MSSDASHYRSDGVSIRSQSTWPDGATDNCSVNDIEIPITKIPERTWLDSPVAMQSPLPGADITSHPSPPLVTPPSKKYQCPTCYLDCNPVGFGRKSDFKKHLYNFHGADVSWICRTKGCHLSFATERAYSLHAKEIHRMEALPNSAARTELCPQLAFACGFANCKERIFEAQSAQDSATSRDKYFEHIAKHFEDHYNVADWEYKVQMHNLMRQHRVKPVWKTCIWPKEKRTALVWRPRSSGDLRRMLECRHLGEDISTLVRLAFILGNSPFTLHNTPPPSEIDLHFSLPYRSQCLADAGTVVPQMGEVPDSPIKSESTPMLTLTKHISYSTPSVFRLGSKKDKRKSRPGTPGSMSGDTAMNDDSTHGPHPGTPFPIPQEAPLPFDAPKFAPEPNQLPKHVSPQAAPTSHPTSYPTSHPTSQPTSHPMQHQHSQVQPQAIAHYASPVIDQSMDTHMGTPIGTPMGTPMSHSMDYHSEHSIDPPVVYTMGGQDNMRDSWYTMNAMGSYTADNSDAHSFYSVRGGNASQSTVRPATPTPHKRPGSWGKTMNMEGMRPMKRSTIPMEGSPHSSVDVEAPRMHHQSHQLQQVPNMYGEPLPTSVSMGYNYEMPMNDGFQGPHPGFAPQQVQMEPMTFFLDDGEARM